MHVVGILGGGQLGRMLAAAASVLNIKVLILDSGTQSPAKQILAHDDHIDGAFTDPAKIGELAAKVDVLTVEIEHVDVGSLERIQEIRPVVICPSPATIRTIQDKFVQKQHLVANNCPVVDFLPLESSSLDAVREASQRLGLPLMLKSRTLAYDGRGNFLLRSLSQTQQAITALGDRPLYAEKWISFVKEVAVMVVRDWTGEIRSYPAVETIHKNNICHLVFAPLRSRDSTLNSRARTLAERVVASFNTAGVFGVEMFLMPDGSLFVNEIAPRPHNSGHYTIEACETSQYENHLRAILALPIGSTALKVPSAGMLNIIGVSSSMGDLDPLTQLALTIPGASLHLYGKSECRVGRKMGHITLVADSDAQLRTHIRTLLDALPRSGTQTDLELYAPPPPARGHSHAHPLVGVIMGSDSDLPTMHHAAGILEQFEVPYELTIVSAHRTPDRLVEYARSAAARGLRTIIAGAGGAAHLPGMVAAMTPLPVIGVPIKGSVLDGVDSLHSIVQMPRGIPVATVAINNSTNAGLLAVRILSASVPRLLAMMDGYMKMQENEVLAKVDKLSRVGWEQYLVESTQVNK